MSVKNPIEQRTQDEIRERLAPRLAAAQSRQEKTRETATLLFFEYGTYPSAKVVHSYTQHGSMTDIQEDLRSFWDDLREKSRVRIEAPMFPDTINATFSEALARIWELAMEKARTALDGERQEAAERVAQAQREAHEAERMRQIAEDDAKESESELRLERDRRETAEKKVEAQAAEIEALQNSLAQWQEKAGAEAKARQDAEERFSRDLEAERSARLRDTEMFEGEIKFAKMQIEAARSNERELRDLLTQTRASRDTEVAIYRQKATQAEETMNAVRVELAELKGRFLALQEKTSEQQTKTRRNIPARAVMKKKTLR